MSDPWDEDRQDGNNEHKESQGRGETGREVVCSMAKKKRENEGQHATRRPSPPPPQTDTSRQGPRIIKPATLLHPPGKIKDHRQPGSALNRSATVQSVAALECFTLGRKRQLGRSTVACQLSPTATAAWPSDAVRVGAGHEEKWNGSWCDGEHPLTTYLVQQLIDAPYQIGTSNNIATKECCQLGTKMYLGRHRWTLGRATVPRLGSLRAGRSNGRPVDGPGTSDHLGKLKRHLELPVNPNIARPDVFLRLQIPSGR